MPTPTPEQQKVLEADARVRVIRAAPGSGKTWLVAEVIRRELDTWTTRTSGIAALSFTRVGGDEIRKAVGYELGHPHFVGTIDAFLFRYVIRPYLRRVFTWFADPRLIPGEWGAEQWSRYGPNQKDISIIGSQGINLFSCVYIDEKDGQEIIAHVPTLQRLTGEVLRQVKAAKKKIWQQRGMLTHSDAAYWATKILEHQTFGPSIRAEVIRRFPLLVVDELQDTGHFLGKSIRLLIQEPNARGLLVGDPDQAIYEFTGARPDLFNTFEAVSGAVTLPLAASKRCPPAVVAAAMHVKDSKGKIGPTQERTGRAFLVRYKDMLIDVPKVVEVFRATRPTALLKVIARGLKTVENLAGRRAEDNRSLYCRPLRHIHRAVVAFRRGRNTSALAAARAAIEDAVFQYEGVSSEELAVANIDSRDWKALAVRCLLKVNAIPMTGTSYDWHIRAGEVLDQEISLFGLSPSLQFVMGKLRPQKRPGWNKPSADYLPQQNIGIQQLAGVPVQTVHGVKGETHDITIFVCPEFQSNRCPSAVWWSPNDVDREERRIAYVAMTRSQSDLIVCVSEESYLRLATKHEAFVKSFECITASDVFSRKKEGIEKV